MRYHGIGGEYLRPRMVDRNKIFRNTGQFFKRPSRTQRILNGKFATIDLKISHFLICRRIIEETIVSISKWLLDENTMVMMMMMKVKVLEVIAMMLAIMMALVVMVIETMRVMIMMMMVMMIMPMMMVMVVVMLMMKVMEGMIMVMLMNSVKMVVVLMTIIMFHVCLHNGT